MDNKVLYVSISEITVIKENLNKSEDTFMMEIEGSQIRNLTDYLSCISRLMKFPSPSRGIDSYNDWMCDLEWIKQNNIVLIVNDYEQFLRMDLLAKKDIIDGFTTLILPWWQEDVISCCVGGEPRKFMVYLVI